MAEYIVSMQVHLHMCILVAIVYSSSCCQSLIQCIKSTIVIAKHAMLQHQRRVMIGLDDDNCRQYICKKEQLSG